MEERREGHPFHMYDAILSQPEAFASVLAKNEAAVDEFAAGASSFGRPLASASSCERMASYM